MASLSVIVKCRQSNIFDPSLLSIPISAHFESLHSRSPIINGRNMIRLWSHGDGEETTTTFVAINAELIGHDNVEQTFSVSHQQRQFSDHYRHHHNWMASPNIIPLHCYHHPQGTINIVRSAIPRIDNSMRLN